MTDRPADEVRLRELADEYAPLLLAATHCLQNLADQHWPPARSAVERVALATKTLIDSIAALRAERDRLQEHVDAVIAENAALGGDELVKLRAERDAANARATAMREVLEWLDRRGGLGLDAHDWVKRALGGAAGEEKA